MENEFRRWIRLVESMTLSEAYRRKFEDQDGQEYTVWCDPLRNDVMALLKKYPHGLRGFVNQSEMFVWDATSAIHQTIENLIREQGDWPYAGMVSIIIGRAKADLETDSIYQGWEDGDVQQKGGLAWQAISDVSTFPAFQRAIMPPKRDVLGLN